MTKKDIDKFKEKHGKDFFSKIGKKGAETFWSRYYILPVELTRFAIYRKDNNQFVNYFGG